MITEDYVSFETAKLLKEKGFDVYGDGSFGSSIKVWMEYSPFGKIRDISTSTPSVKGFPAPTLQMAMKWLREVHHLWIDIDPLTGYKWTWSIWIMNDPDQKMGESLQSISTHKEACEEAIKYCLTELI